MIDQIVELLKTNKYFSPRISHIEIFPEHGSRNCNVSNLSPKLQNYLRIKNINLYLHQCQVLNLCREGKNVIITTPTASGKTLAYNLPIFETLETNSQATALYLYPTKALTNDQLQTFREMEKITGIKTQPAIYDGDTPSSIRAKIRNTSRILLTNPYELHQILPWNYQWIKLLSNLRYIVIDEAHQYRGVFGSNVAYLIRRLRRILNRLGAEPQFILSSATLANAQEFANNLTGLKFEHVQADGSPKGKKYFIFYNPFYKPDIDTSAAEEASRLLVTFVYHGLKTLVFAQSRRVAELIARRSREILQKKYPQLAQSITAYRSGYLPSERRQIERQFRQGQLKAIASTNALELGIDIGDLDAVIITGFPGTIISTMQQAGRAGRKAKPSLAVLVAYHDKLDQYFVKNPHKFFSRPFEHAIIDMKNPYIATGQILCAAAEMPVTEQDKQLFPADILDKILQSLSAKNLLKNTERGWIYTGKTAPTQVVSLDNISSDIYRVMFQGKVLETMDQIHAFKEAHKEAVLLHQGETYVVEEFDLKNKIINVIQKNVNYYTVPLKTSEAKILQILKQRNINGYTLYLGRLQATEQYIGYKMKRGNQVIGYGKLDLPPVEFQTVGIWFTMDEQLASIIWQSHPTQHASIPSIPKPSVFYDARLDIFAGGLHGVEHALIGVMPFHVMADRWDIGGLSTTDHPETGKPTIFIYDGYPGGIGLSEKAFNLFEKIVEMTYALVKGCGCKDGCPACIMSPKCGNDNRPLDKFASIKILEWMTGKD